MRCGRPLFDCVRRTLRTKARYSSSARAQVSYSIRHSVFSRRWMSRREMSRSITVRERTGVSESGGVDQRAEVGTAGASPPCSRHHPSHLPTAARRAFQVFTAAEPHRHSSAAPISASVTAASARLSARSWCV